jgi:hypothetical protein
MPSTTEALIILVLAIAPGLLFELGVERGQAYWRTSFSDRLLRFFAWSFLLHALLLPISHWLWNRHLADGWSAGTIPLWPLYAAALAYTFVPMFLGHVVGGRSRVGAGLRRLILGADLPPRAWDHLFAARPGGYVRACLVDGTWVAGTWAFSSSYPAEDDFLLDRRVRCDPLTGELLLDDEGFPVAIGWSLLLRRVDVGRIEFQEFQRVER